MIQRFDIISSNVSSQRLMWKNYLRYVFTVGHYDMSNVWYIMSSDRALASDIDDYI